jgi:DNA modification methylase
MSPNVLLEIAELQDKTVSQLVQRYEQVFEEECRSRNKQYLIRRIAWRLQANEEGGLSRAALKKAEELAIGAETRVTAPRKNSSEGVKLVLPEPRSNNAIAAGLSSFTNDGAASRLKGGQGNAASFGVDHETGKPKHAATHKKLRAKDRPLANDFVSDEAFDQLLDDWFGNIARVLLPGRCFYIWGGYANCGNYPPVLKKHGLYFSQSIIWDKQHPVLTRKDFMGAHEWAFYGWKEGAGHKYYGPNNATDLWQVKKINPQSMSHLTQKPAELAVRAMQYSSVQGENVLDLFGGSGSTMIGAEQCGRNSFLMELDTLYCDVIVDRFQRFTGTPAVLERTGESPIPMKAREENMR